MSLFMPHLGTSIRKSPRCQPDAIVQKTTNYKLQKCKTTNDYRSIPDEHQNSVMTLSMGWAITDGVRRDEEVRGGGKTTAGG